MADCRMAKARERPGEILAVHAFKGHRFRTNDRYHDDAMAHRARLPGAETGGGPRAFRRTKLARVPSSRDYVYRGLWVPGLREERFSPLATSIQGFHPKISPSQTLQTQRLPRSGLSATFRTRSQPCAAVSTPAS